MRTLTAVIVEDAYPARLALRAALDRLCPDVAVLAEAETTEAAYETLSTSAPDLVFLDIHLGEDETAFDLLRRLHQENKVEFDIVFITGDGTYENALRAIEFSAMDFLVKPLDGQRLRAAVDKVQRTGMRKLRRQMELFLEHLATPHTTNFAFRTVGGGLEFVDLEEVLYLQGAEQICRVHLQGGRQFSVVRNLGYYTKLLEQSSERFFPISQKVLLNLRHLKSYHHTRRQVLLNNGVLLEASRRGAQDFRRYLSQNGSQLPVPLSRQTLFERVWKILQGDR
jgi:two-component system LytT family response regulator